MKRKKIRIGGMTCISCQNKIERKLNNTAGIESATVDYAKGIANVIYHPDMVTLKEIAAVIERMDYKVLADNQTTADDKTRAVGFVILILSLFMLLQQFGLTNFFSSFPLAEEGMGYGMLFLIGLLTSVHCVAMCGGINLSQCIPQVERPASGPLASMGPSFLYNLGRIISYTVIGGLVGALGGVISFSGVFKGVVQLAAGVFMVIMGINMLGLFPSLRKLTPHMPRIFASKINEEKGRSKSPLYVGLLNGLMPCGPLQAMQLYALSTGSMTQGALSMLLFSLGTVPLMFGLGALSSVLSKKFTRKVMTAGAVLVVVLGLSMFSSGMSLSGFSFAGASGSSQGGPPVVIENGVQQVSSTLASGGYPAITVQSGIPVRWTIEAPEGSINGCNNRILIPEYNIEYQFQPGENVIEFTPTTSGKFPYSCWMGMIRSSITVVDSESELRDGSSPSDNGNGAEASTDGTNGADSDQGFFDYGTTPEPVSANISIPTEKLAVAEKKGGYQTVSVELTDRGFVPAIVVVQAGTSVQWVIRDSSAPGNNAELLIPAYSTKLTLSPGNNTLNFVPLESFDFSSGDHTRFGYIKVVDDLSDIDAESIKAEVRDFETMIWPPELFNAGGTGGAGGASCH
ncbi:sulfite exporter TauE/SafE family protein [Anoxybacterium hadale]|uniref:urease accessory protein UreH domain-containing protein n=1 Tax=Anoxybacterium hadale TaxID=3408580 RepID=UPI003AFFFB5D